MKSRQAAVHWWKLDTNLKELQFKFRCWLIWIVFSGGKIDKSVRRCVNLSIGIGQTFSTCHCHPVSLLRWQVLLYCLLPLLPPRNTLPILLLPPVILFQYFGPLNTPTSLSVPEAPAWEQPFVRVLEELLLCG